MIFPFLVPASNLSLDELNGLVDLLEDKLCGEFSTNRKDFFDVINNYIEVKRDSALYVSGPFIGVSILEENSLNPVKRITINNKVPSGVYEYSYSEFLGLFNSKFFETK